MNLRKKIIKLCNYGILLRGNVSVNASKRRQVAPRDVRGANF